MRNGFVLLLIIFLAGCGTKAFIPFKEKVDKVIIQTEAGEELGILNDKSQIDELLSIMNSAKESSVGDPEPNGTKYSIILETGGNKYIFTLKEASYKGGNDKIFSTDSLPKAWIVDKRIWSIISKK